MVTGIDVPKGDIGASSGMVSGDRMAKVSSSGGGEGTYLLMLRRRNRPFSSRGEVKLPHIEVAGRDDATGAGFSADGWLSGCFGARVNEVLKALVYFGWKADEASGDLPNDIRSTDPGSGMAAP
jgi:hypothetical protein